MSHQVGNEKFILNMHFVPCEMNLLPTDIHSFHIQINCVMNTLENIDCFREYSVFFKRSSHQYHYNTMLYIHI